MRAHLSILPSIHSPRSPRTPIPALVSGFKHTAVLCASWQASSCSPYSLLPCEDIIPGIRTAKSRKPMPKPLHPKRFHLIRSRKKREKLRQKRGRLRVGAKSETVRRLQQPRERQDPLRSKARQPRAARAHQNAETHRLCEEETKIYSKSPQSEKTRNLPKIHTMAKIWILETTVATKTA